MNKKILFAALFLAALSIGFVACDVFDPDLGKENEDENDNIENVVDDDSTDIDSDSIDNVEDEEDYYNCDSTEMVCTGKAYDITGTTAKVTATVHIPLTLLAQCQLGVQVSSSKEDLMAHENVTNFTTKDLTGNDFVVNLKNLKSNSTKHYYCAYIYLNGIYHYGLIREFNTLCVLTTEQKHYTFSGEDAWREDDRDCIVDGAGEYAPGSKVTLSATLGATWCFDFWSDCDNKELTRTITITSDTTITANFRRKPHLTVNYSARITEGVTGFFKTLGSGYYTLGEDVTISVSITGSSYYLYCWDDCDSKEVTRTITLTSDSIITAKISTKPCKLDVVSKSIDDYGFGTTLGSGYYMSGDEVTITARPNSYAMFVEWNDGNTDNPRTVIVNKSNDTYTAYFCKNWVDLGLSVDWATHNVGATKPEEYGDYFAWGETTPKTTYNLSTYKWCNGSSTTMTKYCTSSSYGTVDNKTILDPEDDAATVNMGRSWRMPTYDEFNELKTKCTWTRTTLNGVNGYNVEGPNGNSIFLPAAGFRYDGDLDGVGLDGGYWSSSLTEVGSSGARGLFYSFWEDDVDWFYAESRTAGNSVRGVRK